MLKVKTLIQPLAKQITDMPQIWNMESLNSEEKKYGIMKNKQKKKTLQPTDSPFLHHLWLLYQLAVSEAWIK